MPSVAVVNALKRFAGSTFVAQSYLKCLKNHGYQANWYQCTDSKELADYLPWPTIVPGLTTRFESLNLAANRLYFFPHKLKGLKEDLILATDQILAGLVDHHKNCIVTVHDLRELNRRTRTHLPARILFSFLMPKIARARGIITVSEYTKKQLVEHIKNPPPITVLHIGTRVVGDPVHHLEDSLRRLQEQKILNVSYVAVDRPYKKIDFFLELARQMDKVSSSTGVKFQFHLVSKLTTETLKNIGRNPIPSLKIYDRIEDITDMYKFTDVLAFPSTMEGFGAPPVEAMQFGIPVLVNGMEPMREVVADGGALLPPLDLGSWVNALSSLTDPVHYKEASARSAKRATWFSQEQFEIRMLDALHKWGY